MTKDEAVRLFVARELSSIPLEWVQIIAENKDEEIYAWPMWGTMFLVDDYIGEALEMHSRIMAGSPDEIDLDEIADEETRETVEEAIQALKEEKISWGESAILESYYNEEMAGARCILDKDDDPTAAFLYEVDGRYLIGVNGAGWNFYNGVWDRLYDFLGLQWHDKE